MSVEDGKEKLKKMHEAAMRKLRELSFGELVEVTTVDNCSLSSVMTVDDAWKDVYRVGTNGVLTTTGYYVGHDSNFVLLSSDKIEDREKDRGAINVVLTRYVIKVERVKKKR